MLCIWQRILLLLFLILLTALSSPMVAQAQGPLTLTDRQGEYKVGQYLAYLEDPTGNLTIEDITSPEYAAHFRPSKDEIPNFGFTKSAYWVRFEVRNQASSPNPWLLEQAFGNTHRIDLYFLTPDQRGFVVKRSGNMLPFNTHEFAYHNPIFKLPLPLNQTQTIYLRAKNGSATFFPLTLWSLETFAQKRATADLGWGLFAGFLLLMLVYNFLLFFFLRDKACLFLAAFIGSHLFLYLTTYGFPAQYLWPTVGGWDSFAVLIAIGLCLGTGLHFTMATLSTKTYAPNLHKIVPFLERLAWLFISLVPFVKYEDLIKPISAYIIFVCLLIIWTSFHVILRGYRPARYFMLGVFFIGMYETLFNFARFGFIPTNTSLEQVYVVAIMLQMLLFSLTLLDRINLLKAKTEEAHRQLQENEQRMTQFIEAMPIGVIVQDHQEVTKFINHHARQIFDLPHYSAQLPNINSATVQFIVSNSGKPYPLEQLPYKRALQGEWVFTDDLEVVFVGKSVPLEIWSSPIFDEQGTVLYAISAFQDTVERRKAERERLVLSAIQQELSLAQMIQESLLPLAYPNWPKLTVVCYGQPAKEVGGSFYDYYAFPPTGGEQKYAFAIGDVTGRGIPAALLMAVSIALLRAVVVQAALPPSLLLSRLDEMLEHYTQRSKMNCALCYVELTVSATGETVARVANGDLIPPIIKRRSGQVELLEVAGPPLGAGLGKLLGFSERYTTLASGDFLILLNDGVVRAWNTQGEGKSGFERALAMVKAGPSDSADSLIFHLKQETLYLMVGSKQDDDLTIIIVQV